MSTAVVLHLCHRTVQLLTEKRAKTHTPVKIKYDHNIYIGLGRLLSKSVVVVFMV